MLASLIKFLLFVAIVAGLTVAAGYLLERDDGLTVIVAGTEYTFDAFESVIAACVLVVVVWVFLKLLSLLVATLRFLSGDETAFSRWWGRRNERRGFQALTEGMTALASGEPRLAMSKAAQAERYLQRPELTNLLVAQAAEMNGDTKKAAETYKQLVTNEKTRFVGVRGIMKQKLSEGDTDTAMKLAEQAFKLKPRHEETQDVLLRLQADAHDWAGARNTLSAKLKHGSLPRDVYTRREAVLALAEAKDILDENATIEEREEAIQANRLSPDLIPAAAMAARSYIKKGKPRYATRILKKAWDVLPHPDLAAAFAEIEPNESSTARLERFQTLTRSHPDHPETKMLLAELNIAAENFPQARRAMGDLAETDPTKRSLTLMAAIERGEGADDSVVKAWLAKAVTASPGPQWICEVDGKAYAEWTPITDGGFDTLTWKTAPASEAMTGNAVGMLPLIVGSQKPDPVPEPRPEPEPDVVEATAEEAKPETEPAKA
ncbi:MAG: heme biosynthesis HemY N-terminal domain-containing protein [Pseudomonadota bacterium]